MTFDYLIDYFDQLLTRLASSSLLVRLLTIIMTSLLMFALGYMMVLRNQINALSSAKNREIQLVKRQEQQQILLANAVFYPSNAGNKPQAYMAKLPLDADLPGVLKNITDIGEDNGLSFNFIQPDVAIKHSNYIAMPMKFIIVGTYLEISHFLQQMNAMQQIILWQDFSLQPEQSGDKSPSSDTDITTASCQENCTESTGIIENPEATSGNHIKLMLTITARLYSLANPPVIITTHASVLEGETSKVNYSNRNRRDPFQKINYAYLSASLNEDSMLTKFSIKELHTLGIITQRNQRWAVLAMPNGLYVTVKVGDQVGIEKQRVLSINAKTMFIRFAKNVA